MIRKATQITVPIIGSAELDVNSLAREHEKAMENLNEKLGDGWKIFSTHTVTNNLTAYLVYVLTKIEVDTENYKEEEDC